MNIANERIDDGSVYFIAEAGVNHNGDLERAKEMIEIAADAGADAVKFQAYDTDRLVHGDAELAAYQSGRQDDLASQHDLLAKYELDREDHDVLLRHASDADIHFLSSVFDRNSVELLDALDVPAFKIGSGELTNHPLLEYVAEFGRPLIVSTGMATMGEVSDALEAIRDQDPDVELALLHCVSAYPAEMEDVNLRAMMAMAERFRVPIGFSDHTMELETPGFAVAAGARIVEKHFTIDRSLPGPDHDASLEPDELATAIRIARDAAVARGSAEKRPVAAERDTRQVSRRSLHASTDIAEGDTINEASVSVLRPATGIPPSELSKVIGSRALRDIRADDPITADAIEEGDQS